MCEKKSRVSKKQKPNLVGSSSSLVSRPSLLGLCSLNRMIVASPIMRPNAASAEHDPCAHRPLKSVVAWSWHSQPDREARPWQSVCPRVRLKTRPVYADLLNSRHLDFVNPMLEHASPREACFSCDTLPQYSVLYTKPDSSGQSIHKLESYTRARTKTAIFRLRPPSYPPNPQAGLGLLETRATSRLQGSLGCCDI